MSVVSEKENDAPLENGIGQTKTGRGSIKDHVFAVPTAPVRKVKDTALTPVPWRKVDGYNRKGVMRYTPRMATPNSVRLHCDTKLRVTTKQLYCKRYFSNI